MIRLVVFCGVLALMGPCPQVCLAIQADEETPDVPDVDVNAEYEALVAEYESLVVSARSAASEGGKTSVYEKKRPKPQEYFPRFLEIAERGGKNKGAAKALLWIVEKRLITEHRMIALEMLVATAWSANRNPRQAMPVSENGPVLSSIP